MRPITLLLIAAALAGEEEDPRRREEGPPSPAAGSGAESRGGGTLSASWNIDASSLRLDDRSAVVVLVVAGAVVAVVAPLVLVDDGYETARFPARPFADGADGATLVGRDAIAAHRAGGGRAQWWTGRIACDGALRSTGERDADGQQGGPSRVGARLALDTAWRLGLEIGIDAWADDDDGWDDAARAQPPERAADVLLTWRFAHSPRSAFRLGAGPALRRAGGHERTGVALLYEMEGYASPFIIGATGRWASVGDDVIDGRVEGRLGVMVGGGCEARLGVELARVDHTTRWGPLLGVRWWF